MATYQIVGECAHVTADSPTGKTIVLRHKGALVSADDPRLQHLLDSGLVAKVADAETGGLNADGLTVFEAARKAESGDATEVAATPAPAGDVPVPDGRAGKVAWVEYGVAQGRDRAALEALSRDDLVKELKPQG